MEDGVVDLCGIMLMSWIWYWEENDYIWCIYDKDCLVRLIYIDF